MPAIIVPINHYIIGTYHHGKTKKKKSIRNIRIGKEEKNICIKYWLYRAFKENYKQII